MDSKIKQKGTEVFEMIGLDTKITQKEIEDFLADSKFLYLYLLLENIKVLKMEMYDLEDNFRKFGF
jgi:hypothetical protein